MAKVLGSVAGRQLPRIIRFSYCRRMLYQKQGGTPRGSGMVATSQSSMVHLLYVRKEVLIQYLPSIRLRWKLHWH